MMVAAFRPSLLFVFGLLFTPPCSFGQSRKGRLDNDSAGIHFYIRSLSRYTQNRVAILGQKKMVLQIIVGLASS